MEKDFCKICLESSGNLIEKRIPESKGSGLIYSVYAYYDDESEGIFAVRETKEAAIEALKKAISKEIFDKEEEVTSLKKKLKILSSIVEFNPDSDNNKKK